MALFILIFKIELLNSKAVCYSNGVRVNNKENGGDNDSNSNNKKLRKKLIKLKSENLAKSKKIARNRIIRIRLSFLIFTIKEIFNQLQLVFTKIPILCYFNLECYIWIENNLSKYDTNSILNSLTFGIIPNLIASKTNLSQSYLRAFFLKEIILTKT